MFYPIKEDTVCVSQASSPSFFASEESPTEETNRMGLEVVLQLSASAKVMGQICSYSSFLKEVF